MKTTHKTIQINDFKMNHMVFYQFHQQNSNSVCTKQNVSLTSNIKIFNENQLTNYFSLQKTGQKSFYEQNLQNLHSKCVSLCHPM